MVDNSNVRCPSCDRSMELRCRNNIVGNLIEGLFWGCSGFPACRAGRTIKIEKNNSINISHKFWLDSNSLKQSEEGGDK